MWMPVGEWVGGGGVSVVQTQQWTAAADVQRATDHRALYQLQNQFATNWSNFVGNVSYNGQSISLLYVAVG